MGKSHTTTVQSNPVKTSSGPVLGLSSRGNLKGPSATPSATLAPVKQPSQARFVKGERAPEGD